MFSFGVLLVFMHFPTAMATLTPGQPFVPPGGGGGSTSGSTSGSNSSDVDLIHLLQQLLAVDPKQRPTAANCVVYPYFRGAFIDNLLKEGEMVEQDRKLDAVRHLIQKTRNTHRSCFDKVIVRRANVLEDVLKYFIEMPLDKIKHLLKVEFADEPGVDEGGLLTEMFSMFFEDVFSPSNGLFEGHSGADVSTSVTAAVLPSSIDDSASRLRKLRAVGVSMVKALYEGKRIGNRLCPFVFKYFASSSPSPTLRDLQIFDPQSAKSLQWMMATSGVEQFSLHFESVGMPETGSVTDGNKAKFVGMKIEKILLHSRSRQLEAMRRGFVEALTALSEEAAPFLSLLSHTDWRVMLCGESVVNAHQIVAALAFSGFPRKSQLPQWLKELILSFSDDLLRKFLVFVTGSPSLPSSNSSVGSSSSSMQINIRFLPRSGSLPVAHTCFFHLDIPDYRDKEILASKLLYAMQNANTFEIV